MVRDSYRARGWAMLDAFYISWGEACERLALSESALSQCIAAGKLQAFIQLSNETAFLSFDSGTGGIAPGTGSSFLARWRHIGRPRKPHTPTERIEGAAERYILSGWFRVEADSLKNAALTGSKLIARVIPPSQGDGTLSDGDVFVVGEQDPDDWDTDVDGNKTWLGDFIPNAKFIPSLRELWFSVSAIEQMRIDGHGITSVSNTIAKEDLGSRERNNLLRVIAALAKSSDIDVSSPGAAKAIDGCVVDAGFDGPKEKTIRTILDGVRNLD